MSMNLDQSADTITPSSGTLNIAGAILPTTALAVGGGGTGVTTSTGSGNNVLSTSPTLVTPVLGTPTSGTLTNCTGLPVGGISATGTPSSSTYLRGDGSWSTISAGSPGGSNTQVQYNSSGSFAGSANFTFDGTNVLVAGTVSGGSDERLKKNWRGVVLGFIEKLSKVKAGIFDRIDADITQPGVSAQSLQEVLPEAVLTGEDGMLSVNYGGAALLSVIELAKEVVALRAEIEALKAN